MFKSTLAFVLLTAAWGVSGFGCNTPYTYTTCPDGRFYRYDPDDGMICDILDCGGGRAPPKTTVPCCPLYQGTEPCVTGPSYLPCFAAAAPTPAPPSATVPAVDIITTTTTSLPTIVDPVSPSPLDSNTPSAPSTTSTSTIAAAVETSSDGTTITSTTNSSRSDSTATTTLGSTQPTGATETTRNRTLSTSHSAMPSSTLNAAVAAQPGSLIAFLGAAVGVVLL